jgi:hypothetical protein
MLEGITNTVFMVAFGLLIGVLFGLFTVLSETYEKPRESTFHLRKNPGESFGEYFRRLDAELDEDNKKNREEIATWPKSVKIVSFTFLAFILVLVLVINITPIRMSWPVFSGTAFGVAVICSLVFDKTIKR